MSDFLKSLSSYDIFNNLLPGVVFCVLTSKMFSVSLIQSDVVTGIFFYYFTGLIISRVGSIVLKPLLEKIRFISFSSYSDFISASQEDPKIEILSEANNMYRTMLSMMMLLALTGAYCFFKEDFEFLAEYSAYIFISLSTILFAFSYRKQTNFIKSRIEKSITKVSNQI